MILVLTTELGDDSHAAYIDWLDYFEANYFILSGEGIHNGRYAIELDSNGNLFIDKINFTKEVNVVFNRRFLTLNYLSEFVNNDLNLNKELNKILHDELYAFRNVLPHLNQAYWIPNAESVKVNKLDVLYKAQQCGLLIPDFLVTNNKTSLLSFISKHGDIITKAIGNFRRVKSANSLEINPILTKPIDLDFVQSLPNNFSLSFFQEMIKKDFEYRVLFFEDSFFTAKLLSQENDHSVIDSRAQNNTGFNVRIIKSKLPDEVEVKLIYLMKTLNLNIGCIDLMQKDEDFYFLEVNPIGQTGGYSTRANLAFEKNVVQKMIELDG